MISGETLRAALAVANALHHIEHMAPDASLQSWELAQAALRSTARFLVRRVRVDAAHEDTLPPPPVIPSDHGGTL